MRPIDKGPTPEINGKPIAVKNHRSWRKYLIDSIGAYCSYCEMKLNDSPQVEHVVAQDIDPTRELDWDNLVLACGPCNRTKSNNPCPPATHYLPDVHNTYLAFEFYISINTLHANEPAAFIKVRTDPGPGFPKNAQNTITLCALDRDTTADARKVTDLRWRYRLEAIAVATIWKKDWDDWGKTRASDFIRLLITVALSSGFFSVWFRIFETETIVKEALVNAFKGTASVCFHAVNSFKPIWRNTDDI
jgi:hypothetical protein